MKIWCQLWPSQAITGVSWINLRLQMEENLFYYKTLRRSVKIQLLKFGCGLHLHQLQTLFLGNVLEDHDDEQTDKNIYQVSIMIHDSLTGDDAQLMNLNFSEKISISHTTKNFTKDVDVVRQSRNWRKFHYEIIRFISKEIVLKFNHRRGLFLYLLMAKTQTTKKVTPWE